MKILIFFHKGVKIILMDTFLKNYKNPLGKSKNFKNIKIFNNIGSHDGLRKKNYQNRPKCR